MNQNPDDKNRGNKWLVFINIPIQMGAIIFAFAWFGDWLDSKYGDENRIYMKVLILLGVSIAFYNLHRQVKSINKNQE